MIKQSKGITLVALVITIVILIILAGITISQLTGENGLFARANQAKQETENAQIEEHEKLGHYENKIEEYVEGTREQIMVDKATYEQLLEDVASLKAQITNLEFSTTEKVVGTWIDGKPIYRKVIATNLPTVTTGGIVTEKKIDHNISNVEKFINVGGTFGGQPLNQVIYGSNNIVRTFANASTLYIQCSILAFSDCEANVILEYTKTTDNPTNN